MPTQDEIACARRVHTNLVHTRDNIDRAMKHAKYLDEQVKLRVSDAISMVMLCQIQIEKIELQYGKFLPLSPQTERN